ncbi:DNA primase [Sporanaerobium hydrogeniformans]|uniref:DNA primase n=1 Tax=Sporanaerobium hydrogeniformans TaxID=3072179 RepID=A0AC61DCQ3_9FIRM|nr:DNA primase [Sporanaerobium hydrogeniformans]PHV71064.1 DNA primase [Sporanaerobium hydrogeniformans]
MYPQHVIEEIRQRSDIVSIISEHTSLTKKGNNYTGLCPFHTEKTPSFSVSEDKQLYYCFGCGAGGNILTFLMQKENMNFVEALKYLAERENISLEEDYLSPEEVERTHHRQKLLEVLKEAGKYFYYMLRDATHKEVLHYLTERGLNLDTIKQFGIGYSPATYNGLYKYLEQKGYSKELLMESGLFVVGKQSQVIADRFMGRVIFPIFDTSKKVIAFGARVLDNSLPKYLNSPENLLFNKSNTLYGLHLARSSASTYFILVEGYMDVIAMHQAGFTQTVASLGTAFTPLHAKLLKRYTKEVVILYDSDSAGIKAVQRAIPILRNEGLKVRVLQLKEGKDPDEYLKTHGRESLKRLLEEATTDVWFEISRLELQYDLKVTEQKVKFLQEVAYKLSDLESSIEQTLYAEEISEQYGIDLNVLKAEIVQHYKRKQLLPRGYNAKASVPVKKPVLSAEVNFLATIYHYPHIGKQIGDYVTWEMFETPLLQDLARVINEVLVEQKPLDMDYFAATYPEAQDQTIISYVLMNYDERYEDQSVLEKMVLENIKRIKKSYIEKKSRTAKDVTEIQNLLLQKNDLDKLYIDFRNG